MTCWQKLCKVATMHRSTPLAASPLPTYRATTRVSSHWWAASLDNIGVTLRVSGRVEEALEKHEKALDIRLSKLGEGHVDVARTRYNMAVILRQQGDAARARELLEGCAEVYGKVYGPEHSETADAKDLFSTCR
mmetsp:Transcript_44225/g.110769  ORF Transcript_44225/g.110769 Transcript_44225/m.110769 type:complete len:134 (-) Transcript_44225:14-415(-)